MRIGSISGVLAARPSMDVMTRPSAGPYESLWLDWDRWVVGDQPREGLRAIWEPRIGAGSPPRSRCGPRCGSFVPVLVPQIGNRCSSGANTFEFICESRFRIPHEAPGARRLTVWASAAGPATLADRRAQVDCQTIPKVDTPHARPSQLQARVIRPATMFLYFAFLSGC